MTTRSWYRKNHVTHNVTATGLKCAHSKVQVLNMNTCTMDGTGSIKMTEKGLRIFVGIFYVRVKSLMIMSYCDVSCLWLMHILMLTRNSERLMFDRLHLGELNIIYLIHSLCYLTTIKTTKKEYEQVNTVGNPKLPSSGI